jgi:hypothetical protein
MSLPRLPRVDQIIDYLLKRWQQRFHFAADILVILQRGSAPGSIKAFLFGAEDYRSSLPLSVS